MASDTLERARGVITPALAFHTDIVAKCSSGIYVEGADGRRYMDFTSGLATANLGHCHPRVVRAVKEQAERFVHSGCIFHYEPIVEAAERLKKVTPEGIDMFFFSNSGAEAVEGAVKLARRTTGRQGVVAFTGSFHGRSFGAMSLTSSTADYRKGYHPLLPSVFHAPYPYCYRCFLGKSRTACAVECIDYLERIFQHLISPEEVACVVIEPVLGEGGYAPAPEEFLGRLRVLCTERGILLVADEVQSGFGRTGSWFACQHYGIRPDIITMAKAIASGLPLSAIGASAGIMREWSPGAHGTTFGGNPLSCAAACATIDTIEGEGLLGNAARVGEYALERLRGMMEGFPFIGDVRGMGLMIGVEIVKEDGSPDPGLLEGVVRRCGERGLVIVECGTHRNVIRLMPPLITTMEEMERGLNILEEALG